MASTFAVSCPCGCSKVCSAVDKGFSATTVEITDPCFGVPVVDRKSAVYALAIPEGTVQHRDGLVVF